MGVDDILITLLYILGTMLTQPLLDEYDSDGEEEFQRTNNGGNDNDDATTETDTDSSGYEKDDTNDKSSEKFGVFRLLRFMHSHTTILLTSCVVLIIRLPFSLAIPHLVAQTIYSAITQSNQSLQLISHDSSSGTRSAEFYIILIIICGSIDSILDFFTVYLFGVSQQRVVTSLRRVTFQRLMKQVLLLVLIEVRMMVSISELCVVIYRLPIYIYIYAFFKY